MLKNLRSQLVHEHVPHRSGEAILDVRGLGARYNGSEALVDVSFSLLSGERVAVIGPNGAGKSTLFKIIAGVQPASAGEVRIFGFSPENHICIAYVPQRSQVDWSFPATVADVVMMGRIGKIGLFRLAGRRDRQKVAECLKLVGMASLGNRQIGELSSGQQQRVFIAQAMAQEADLILMDESLTGLDLEAREHIFSILELLKARQVNVMLATHDLQLAELRFDRVMLLNRRLIAFGDPEEVLAPDTLLSAYSGRLHILHSGSGLVTLVEDSCHDNPLEGGSLHA